MPRHTTSPTTRREQRAFLAFAGIALLGFLLFYAYPIARTFWLGMTDTRIGAPTVDFVGADNYIAALTGDDLFWHSMSLSLAFAFTSGPLSLGLALVGALLLNTKLNGVPFFRTVYFLPFVIPTFAVAALFKGLFHPSSGLVNEVLAWLGIQGPGWYLDSSTALGTMVIMSAWGFGVKMIIFLAALQGVQAALYEAADLEGASAWRKFRSVTFPAISPVFFFNVVLTTIDVLKSFNLAFFMGKGNGFPANSTLLYPIYLFNEAFRSPFNLGYASALAWLMFCLILVLTGINLLLSRFYVNEDVE